MKIEHQQLKVTLMSRVKIAGKWRRLPVIYGRTGRVIPGLIIWAGKELKFEGVAYELRHYKDGKAVYAPAGRNASDAEEKRRILQSQLSAKAIAQAAGIAVAEPTERMMISAWVREYLKKKSLLIGRDQLQRIRYVIALFLRSCKKMYLDEIAENDILEFLDLLAKLPVYDPARRKPSKRTQATQIRRRLPVQQKIISPRTIFSYFISARAWLCDSGVDRKVFPPPPKYQEREVTIYSPEEIEAFFSLATGDLRMATSLMLKCGMRRQEAAHACFSDIDYSDKTIVIRGKSEYGFQTKTRKQRVVPVPDDLFEELIQWKRDHPNQNLIVQTLKGKPDLRMIRSLKRFVYLHGLRCGHCGHCRSGNPNCANWELHKFRRTYLTRVSRKTDLRTAQDYAGHTRLSSTQRYLKPASAAEGQKRVSSIDWTKPDYE